MNEIPLYWIIHIPVPVVEFWGLPPLILFFNMSIGWCGRFALSTECYRTRKLGYKNLNWPRCSARVTESLALTDGSFCRKQTLYILDYVRNCEFMMCILIVNHKFIRMHPWCSRECMLPGRCSPGKRRHTFWNTNIVLLPIRFGNVSCVPGNKDYEWYGLMFWEGLA